MKRKKPESAIISDIFFATVLGGLTIHCSRSFSLGGNDLLTRTLLVNNPLGLHSLLLDPPLLSVMRYADEEKAERRRGF